MRPTIKFFIIFVFSIALASCSNKDSKPPEAANAPVFDTAAAIKPVTINDAQHFIYFRPKVGDVYRYKISMTSTAGAETEDHIYNQFPPKESATGVNVFYIKETVKSIKAKDSSIEFSFSYDSIVMNMDRDTLHIKFSTNNADSKNDQRFKAYSDLAGETFGFIISKYGEIQEIFNTTSLVTKYMKGLPDSANTQANRDKVKQMLEANLSQTLGHTLVAFPPTPLAKDTVMTQMKEINIPIWQQILFPVRLQSKTTMDGFQDRGGKVLASFTTVTALTPLKMSQEDPAAKVDLAGLHTNIRENILVEDSTGMLVHRQYVDDRGWEFTLAGKKAPEKFFHRKQFSTERTIVDLLR